MSIRAKYYKAKEIAKRDGILAVYRRVLRKLIGKSTCYIHRWSHRIQRTLDSSDELKIAFYPTGGLGDYIVSAKILEELLALVKCNVDIYCEKFDFGKAIYGNRTGVNVKPFEKFEEERYESDLALTVEHFIHIRNANWSRLKSISPNLYARLRYIKDNWGHLYVDIPQQCFRELVHFERCRIQGLNRWTELRMGKAFDVIDQKVSIPMNDEYREMYEKLSFAGREFITMNCGTDAMRSVGTQTKAWMNSYYEELAQIIKHSKKNIMIVQLGSGDGIKLKNMDFHIMGESLELTKWILKGSKLHVDIEGGLVHLATQLGTRCAVLFGPTPQHMYAYEQNENICNEKCYGCMGCHEDWAYRCYKGNEVPMCMKMITPQLVWDRIKKYIEGI